MATEKRNVERLSTDAAHDHDLTSVDTNDHVAPEIIGTSRSTLHAGRLITP